MAKYDQTNSVIGEGSIFEGRFYISGSLRVDGKFEGDIRTDEALVVGETGKVKTNISAREVILAGTLIGDIDAKDEVRLTETGRMLGDITAAPIGNISRLVNIPSTCAARVVHVFSIRTDACPARNLRGVEADLRTPFPPQRSAAAGRS